MSQTNSLFLRWSCSKCCFMNLTGKSGQRRWPIRNHILEFNHHEYFSWRWILHRTDSAATDRNRGITRWVARAASSLTSLSKVVSHSRGNQQELLEVLLWLHAIITSMHLQSQDWWTRCDCRSGCSENNVTICCWRLIKTALLHSGHDSSFSCLRNKSITALAWVAHWYSDMGILGEARKRLWHGGVRCAFHSFHY